MYRRFQNFEACLVAAGRTHLSLSFYLSTQELLDFIDLNFQVILIVRNEFSKTWQFYLQEARPCTGTQPQFSSHYPRQA
jgi:hypothetical protein